MIWLANQTKSKLGGVNNKKKKEQNAIVFNKNNWFESTIDWIIQPVFDSSLTTVHAKMKMIIKERERERDKIEIFYERRLYQFQEEEMVDWLIDWWRAFSMIDALKLEAVHFMHESFVSWPGDFPDTWRGDAERDLQRTAERIASFSVALQTVYCVCVLLLSNYSFIFRGKKYLSLEAGDLWVFYTYPLLVKKLFGCVCTFFLNFLYSENTHLPNSQRDI